MNDEEGDANEQEDEEQQQQQRQQQQQQRTQEQKDCTGRYYSRRDALRAPIAWGRMRRGRDRIVNHTGKYSG